MFVILFSVFKKLFKNIQLTKRILNSMIPKGIAARYQSNPFKQSADSINTRSNI